MYVGEGRKAKKKFFERHTNDGEPTIRKKKVGKVSVCVGKSAQVRRGGRQKGTSYVSKEGGNLLPFFCCETPLTMLSDMRSTLEKALCRR